MEKAKDLFNKEKDFKPIDTTLITEEINKKLVAFKGIHYMDWLVELKEGKKGIKIEILQKLYVHFCEKARKLMTKTKS